MRRAMKACVVAGAMLLAACTIASHGISPERVPDQQDTYRFRIFPSAFVMEGTFADRAADEEIGRFRSANGYASSAILAREQRDTSFVYTVRFTR